MTHPPLLEAMGTCALIADATSRRDPGAESVCLLATQNSAPAAVAAAWRRGGAIWVQLAVQCDASVETKSVGELALEGILGDCNIERVPIAQADGEQS